MSGEPPPPPYTDPAAPPYQPVHQYPTQSQPNYGTAGYPQQPYPDTSTPGCQPYQTQGDKCPLVPDSPPTQRTIIVCPSTLIWGQHPVQISCPNCHNLVFTETEFVTGTFTWLIGGIILLLGGWILCCLIPFFADSCKDVRHSCPACRTLIHTWHRI